MRQFFIALFGVFLLLSSEAFAGTLEYQNDVVEWKSRHCAKPRRVDFIMDSSGYSEAAKKYLKCVEDEVATDMNKIGKQISTQITLERSQLLYDIK